MLSSEVKPYIQATSGQAMIDLCRPLTERFGIHFLLYVRTYKNGKRFSLTTHSDWDDYFYKHKLYQISAFEKVSASYQPGYYLWSTLPGQQVFNAAREFNIDHGITVVTSHENYTEFCHFATTKGNSKVLNLYISNPEVLQRFIAYFNDHAKKIIHKAKDNLTFLPNNLAQSDESFNFFNKNNLVSDFLSHINAHKCYLKTLSEEVLLTKREGQCLSWLLKGKSMQEVAMIEGISKRTVEAHMEQTKRKLGCYKSFQLGYKLAKLGFKES